MITEALQYNQVLISIISAVAVRGAEPQSAAETGTWTHQWGRAGRCEDYDSDHNNAADENDHDDYYEGDDKGDSEDEDDDDIDYGEAALMTIIKMTVKVMMNILERWQLR